MLGRPLCSAFTRRTECIFGNNVKKYELKKIPKFGENLTPSPPCGRNSFFKIPGRPNRSQDGHRVGRPGILAQLSEYKSTRKIRTIHSALQGLWRV